MKPTAEQFMGALRELLRSYEQRVPDARQRLEDLCAGKVDCTVDADGCVIAVWTKRTTLGTPEAT